LYSRKILEGNLLPVPDVSLLHGSKRHSALLADQHDAALHWHLQSDHVYIAPAKRNAASACRAQFALVQLHNPVKLL
jgi:hypothetical protein